MSPERRNELKLTLKMAVPIIFGQVGQVLMGVTDSAMVGPKGAVSLAASSFVNNILSIPFVFFIGLAACISVQVSQSVGAKNVEQIRKSFWHGLLVSGISAIVISLGLLWLQNHLSIFNQPAEVVRESRGYFIVMCLSLIPMIIFHSFKVFCDAFSNTTIGPVILFSTLVANIFLNWILIYGNWGAPELGLLGAGLATLICRILMAIAIVIHVYKSDKYKIYVSGLLKSVTEMKEIIQSLKIGLPSGLQYLFEVGAFAGAGIMMGWISTEVLAAHQIAISLATLTFMIAMGIGYASSVRVGQVYGEGDYLRVRNIGFSSIYFIAGLEVLFMVMFFLLRDFLPTLYIQDPAVIIVASQLLIYAGLFQIVDGIQTVGIGILRGMSDVNIPTVITLLAYWALGLPLALVLTFSLNLTYVGIWSALAGALSFAAIFLVYRFHVVTNKLLKKSHVIVSRNNVVL
jgi:MATE family multidrug resistance protein